MARQSCIDGEDIGRAAVQMRKLEQAAYNARGCAVFLGCHVIAPATSGIEVVKKLQETCEVCVGKPCIGCARRRTPAGSPEDCAICHWNTSMSCPSR